MIFTAYRLELFKMRKRLATWATFLCFLILVLLVFGGQLYAARHTHGHAYFGFPDSLPLLLTNNVPVASVFGVVLIVLLVCSEFGWKTGRQNIIDGLSKHEWFVGKALLVPTVAVVLYLAQFALGAALAFVGTSPSHLHPADPIATYFLVACGALLAMICYASIGLLICVSVRSTGPALAIALIYQVFENIAARTLRGLHLESVADWLPFQIQSALLAYNQYQPHGSIAHNPLESHWPTGLLFLAAVAWVALLVGVSYRVYMKRDL